VFRDAQAKSLQEQSKARAATKVKHAVARTGQAEMFQSLHEMGPDELAAFMQSGRREAQEALLKLVPKAPSSIQYEKLWPQVLTRHAVRRTDVNQMVTDLYKRQLLVIPDWEQGKRVPQPHYRIQCP
jgi:hypothetical protein